VKPLGLWRVYLQYFELNLDLQKLDRSKEPSARINDLGLIHEHKTAQRRAKEPIKDPTHGFHNPHSRRSALGRNSFI
jgi:hypothetical protein